MGCYLLRCQLCSSYKKKSWNTVNKYTNLFNGINFLITNTMIYRLLSTYLVNINLVTNSMAIIINLLTVITIATPTFSIRWLCTAKTEQNYGPIRINSFHIIIKFCQVFQIHLCDHFYVYLALAQQNVHCSKEYETKLCKTRLTTEYRPVFTPVMIWQLCELCDMTHRWVVTFDKSLSAGSDSIDVIDNVTFIITIMDDKCIR